MITKCRQCDKPVALNKMAWACGPIFCSHNCGVDWAKTLYKPEEYTDDKDLTDKAEAFFEDVAEEITREDFGAKTEYIRMYEPGYDMTVVFEQVSEGEDTISMTCIGWYYGKDEVPIEDVIEAGMTAIFAN